MDTEDKKYYIRLKSERIEVTKEVYEVYYSMQRKEAYQIERDYRHGLLYYDAWDSENNNGVEYLPDKAANTEEEALDLITRQEFWTLIGQAGDQNDLCKLIADGRTEREIAEILGIAQSTVNRNKNRLYRRFRKKLK